MKIPAKMVLARVPVPYGFWRRVNMFVHGAMDSPDYAYKVVTSHLKRLGWQDLKGKVVLELGPGDSLFTALIANALGAEFVYLVDAGNFATQDIAKYSRGCEQLRRYGLDVPDIKGCTNAQELLIACSAEYISDGLEGLKRIPSGSVDFEFSQAVLEHIRRRELKSTFCELRRVATCSSAGSHEVDLRDHLGGGLNNLRFPDSLWEAEFVARSGFYTNRVQYSEMVALLTETGWSASVTDVKKWRRLPTARRRLAKQFAHKPDGELLVYGFDVVTRPR